jgi:hypothetical protein
MDGRWVVLILGIMILAVLCQDQISSFGSRKSVNSSVDGKPYRIISKFEGGNDAADMLANINMFLLNVLKYMKTKYVDNPNPKTARHRAYTQRLLNLYNPDVLRENNPRSTVNTSYVTNKGDEIYFCLREKKTGKAHFHDLEVLKFVALHEISHIATTGYGHDDEFWSNFKFIAREAAEAGLYTPVDYRRYPADYCSLTIDYSPLYDARLPYPF